MHKILTIIMLLPPTLLLSIPLILALLNFEPLSAAVMLITLYNYICLWVISIKQRQNPKVQLSKKLWAGLAMSPVASAGSLYLYFDDKFGVFDQIAYFSLAPTLYAGFCAYLAWKAKEGLDDISDSSTVTQKKKLPFTKKLWLAASYLYFTVLTLFIFVGMVGTLLSRGYGAVGDLLSPINLLNWSFIIILALPAMALRKIALAKSNAIAHASA